MCTVASSLLRSNSHSPAREWAIKTFPRASRLSLGKVKICKLVVVVEVVLGQRLYAPSLPLNVPKSLFFRIFLYFRKQRELKEDEFATQKNDE